jgi:hypothetical protein
MVMEPLSLPKYTMLTQFSRILRCFEPEFFHEHQKSLEEIFENFADQEEDGEKVLSNQKFANLATSYNLFGHNSHEQFLARAATTVKKDHGGICTDFG